MSTGELVVPMYGGEPYGASLCVSRDHGATWNATPFSPHVGDLSGKRNCCDEIEVAELPPPSPTRAAQNTSSIPTLYMTIRNDDCPNGLLCPGLESARQFSLSTDLGQSWSPRTNVQVPDCGNKGSVVTLDGNVILSTSASCVNRVNLTVFVSKKGENGAAGSFTHRKLISKSAGYNTMAVADHRRVAILFEQVRT